MEQLTKNQAVATSQEAVQNQNEPQLRDENAHNDKSVHGVLNPTYQAGLRRDAVQPDIEAERRSEERFSRNAETDLVCRLLLEKKKRTGSMGSTQTEQPAHTTPAASGTTPPITANRSTRPTRTAPPRPVLPLVPR